MTRKRDVAAAFQRAQDKILNTGDALAFLDYIDNHVDTSGVFSPAEFVSIYRAFNEGTITPELSSLLIRYAKTLQSEMTFTKDEVLSLLAARQ